MKRETCGPGLRKGSRAPTRQRRMIVPPLPPKKWDIQRIDGRFETAERAKKDRLRLVHRFRTADKAGRRLGKRLKQCKAKERCGSAACRSCGRRVRRWFVGEAMRLLEQIERERSELLDHPILTVTLINRKHQRAPGQLHTLDIVKMIKLLQTQMARGGLREVVVFGGVDFSFNVDATGMKEWEPYWAPHFHLIVIGTTKKALKAALDRHFDADVTVTYPIRIKPLEAEVKGRCEFLSYCLKTLLKRKVYRWTEKGIRPSNEALSRSESMELALLLERFQPTQRLFLKGCSRRGWVLGLHKTPDKLSPQNAGVDEKNRLKPAQRAKKSRE